MVYLLKRNKLIPLNKNLVMINSVLCQRSTARKNTRKLCANALTTFEWKVLAATATIPWGETRSYQWLARTIGKPLAVRAVGQALRKNPFALVIPCHRGIRKNGTLGGYAGKMTGSKKEFLIRIEKETAPYISRADLLTSG